MTRSHATKQLLALGPLPLAEFVEITGWPRKVARYTLAWLVQMGEVEYIGNTRAGVYQVAA